MAPANEMPGVVMNLGKFVIGLYGRADRYFTFHRELLLIALSNRFLPGVQRMTVAGNSLSDAMPQPFGPIRISGLQLRVTT